MKKFIAILLVAFVASLFTYSVGARPEKNTTSKETGYYDGLAAQLFIDRVFGAYAVLQDVAQVTPLIASPGSSADAIVFLKLESLQTTGSFKLRGAYYAVSRLNSEEKERGVVASSAGNHAQGVALAARELGVKATIFIPESAPQEKVNATRSYGADVRVEGKNFTEAKAAAEEFIRQAGGVYIPPYDDVAVIAGQGTIALEILRQMPDVEAVVVPVGGGGLLSGIAYTIKTLKPSCKVYGVEVEGMNGMQLSLAAGKPISVPVRETLADGIAVSAPSDLTFAISRNNVDEVVTVTEEQVAGAMLFLLNEHKLVVEGAGAVSVAAVKNKLLPLHGKKVICIVSGGNLSAQALVRLIENRLP